MAKKNQQLRVFLCHASTDKSKVKNLYHRLVQDGIDAWLDKEKLIPGQEWAYEIPKAVKNSHVVLVCLSAKSITKEGYVQKEILIALDSADEKPEGTIFIIPVRLEPCPIPDRISRFQWVDLFSDDGYERLFKALELRGRGLGIAIRPTLAAPSTKVKIPFSRNDEETAAALYVCFDRPAFRQSFEHESDLEALIAALDDTISAINTGVKKTRDGIVFGAPVKGKAYFDSSELHSAFDQIVVLLSKAKTLYSRAKRAGYFFFGLRSGVAFHGSHQGEAAWVAIRIDELRNEALKIANHVYVQMGLRPFPYIKTPEHYQRSATPPPFANDKFL